MSDFITGLVGGNIVIDLTGLGLTSYSGSFIVAPPEDTDVDPGNITATANAVSFVDPALTASGSDTAEIVVDAILDDFVDVSSCPVADSNESDSEQTIGLGLSLNFSNAGFTGSGDGGTDTDGSELYTVVLTLNAPLPAGATLSTTDGTATITQISATEYEITGANLSTAVGGLQVTVPAGFDGTISGTISTVSIEENTPPESTQPASGAEPDITDNKVEDSATFSVTVLSGDVTPNAAIGLPDGVAAIKEDSFDNKVVFSANTSDAKDELTSIEIVLPGVLTGDIDVTQILGETGVTGVVVTDNGSDTTITITLDDVADLTTFSSFFLLVPRSRTAMWICPTCRYPQTPRTRLTLLR